MNYGACLASSSTARKQRGNRNKETKKQRQETKGSDPFSRCFAVLETHLPGEPRQCWFYRVSARRANKDDILQPTPLEIVYPCGSPGTHPLRHGALRPQPFPCRFPAFARQRVLLDIRPCQ
jgi:hypothetical protein